MKKKISRFKCNAGLLNITERNLALLTELKRSFYSFSPSMASALPTKHVSHITHPHICTCLPCTSYLATRHLSLDPTWSPSQHRHPHSIHLLRAEIRGVGMDY
ncbi:hypothetical protein E2C01_065827 [Portunus trituberculatus]|uniref:Uncharacterized protein n=1 Tax=Portunus trituberculatus TaxID=210409 RepID=A0A5B7HPD0_PORTR|nr:hypothetical protein [Portunus trituberculatus]